MSYVEDNLMPGEKIIYSARVHWFIFIHSAIYFISGLSFVIASKPYDAVAEAFGIFLIIIGAIILVHTIIVKIFTELTITSNRIIAKIGFIWRSTTELNLGKVESINVQQGIFGRIFNFGTLVINGTGGGKTLIKNIHSPLKFRGSAMRAIDVKQL